ncbi:MAG TPA: DUF5719 family protein [Trebonia sp.]|nr:DUF5719 family protein [Trebonia sp.]
MTRRYALFGAVVLVLAVVYAIAWGSKPGGSQPAAAGPGAAQAVTVTSVTRSCPPPAPGTGQASIAVASVPSSVKSAAGRPASGNAALSAVPSGTGKTTTAGGKTASTTVTTPGALTTAPAPDAARLGGTQIDATGRLAAGFEAEQSAANGTGTVTCTHPGADMWFVGTGQEAGAPNIWLYLSNTGVMPASVDVTLLTDAGVQNGLANGITVPPHQYVSVNLAQYVKGSSALAVRVQTSSGQVAANVWESGSGGGAWLPLAASAGTRLVIPGLTAAGSAAKLFVAVPGPTDAQLRITALTAQGKFQPFGRVALDAPSAAASSFPMSSFGASAAALIITSSVPVTAGVLVPGHGIGGFTAAAAPVSEHGLVAGNPAGGGLTTGLVLSAPAAAVRVSVTVLPSANAKRALATPPPRVLTVEAGHTLADVVRPPKGDNAPFAIAVTPQPGSGPLYAARVVTSGGSVSGSLQSVLPVPSALTTIALPPASDTYAAVRP